MAYVNVIISIMCSLPSPETDKNVGFTGIKLLSRIISYESVGGALSVLTRSLSHEEIITAAGTGTSSHSKGSGISPAGENHAIAELIIIDTVHEGARHSPTRFCVAIDLKLAPDWVEVPF